MALKDQYEKAATEGHFAPLLRRMDKIDETITDILNLQDYERKMEVEFRR